MEEIIMAKKTEAVYKSKAKTTSIKATSRCAVKIRDNYYTIEATEERSIPDEAGVDIDAEWSMLFDSVNAVVDNQCQDIINTFSTKK
jgi:hypothetical protein